MAADWDPERYHRFRGYRRKPFEDLLRLVAPCPGGRGLDLGCGSGELTLELHRVAELEQVVGVDSSPRMMDRCRALECPKGVSFEQRSIEEALDASEAHSLDVVLSNAALHWLDDHPALWPRLRRVLKPGGQLAVQVPANDHHPSHAIAAALAQEPAWASKLGGFQRVSPVLAPQRYAELLDAAGASQQQVMLRVYPQHLDGVDGVIEWVRGSVLTAYQRRLSEADFELFLRAYRERLTAALPAPTERGLFYPYDRVLMWARWA